MRLLAVASSVLLLAQVAGAQQRSCHDRFRTTYDVRMCLSRQLARSDSSLRAVEDSLAKELGDSASAALRDAGVKWRAYARAECGAVMASWESGSYAPIVLLDCWLELTSERRQLLRRSFRQQ